MNVWFKYKEGRLVETFFKGKNINALKKQIDRTKKQAGKFDIDEITLRTPGEYGSLCEETLIEKDL